MLVCIQESCDRGTEIDYVVKRLIRGLASSRECARLGFSTVLTHVRVLTMHLLTDFVVGCDLHLYIVCCGNGRHL